MTNSSVSRRTFFAASLGAAIGAAIPVTPGIISEGISGGPRWYIKFVDKDGKVTGAGFSGKVKNYTFAYVPKDIAAMEGIGGRTE